MNKNIKRTFIWVKAHQDKEIKTVEETLNDRVDELATTSRHNAAEGLLGVDNKLFYSESKASLLINGGIVSKQVHNQIVKALCERKMRTYYQNKYQWSDQTFDSI